MPAAPFTRGGMYRPAFGERERPALATEPPDLRCRRSGGKLIAGENVRAMRAARFRLAKAGASGTIP
jgi:hypothetical protein